ncbi:MAG: hypothetical protein AAGJ97_02295 [Planctomycetota bacterium]
MAAPAPRRRKRPVDLPAPTRRRPPYAKARKGKKSGGSGVPSWFVAAGLGLASVGVAIAVVVSIGGSSGRADAEAASPAVEGLAIGADGLLPRSYRLENVELSAPTPVTDGVTVREGTFVLAEPGDPVEPDMSFRLFEPVESAPPGGRPCILNAPAGTTLLTGSRADPGDYYAETVPYAEQGYTVLHFSLSGYVLDGPEETVNERTAAAYRGFRAASAGVVNAQIAFDYARTLPDVDPERIYIAGHSSAGTLALLFGTHEPRLAGVIAYAPATDLSARLGPMIDAQTRRFFPGIDDFIRVTSPDSYDLNIPLYAFHAADDSNVPIEDVRDYFWGVRDRVPGCVFTVVPTGGHYRSMIDRGIPSALDWLDGQMNGAIKSVSDQADQKSIDLRTVRRSPPASRSVEAESENRPVYRTAPGYRYSPRDSLAPVAVGSGPRPPVENRRRLSSTFSRNSRGRASVSGPAAGSAKGSNRCSDRSSTTSGGRATVGSRVS